MLVQQVELMPHSSRVPRTHVIVCAEFLCMSTWGSTSSITKINSFLKVGVSMSVYLYHSRYISEDISSCTIITVKSVDIFKNKIHTCDIIVMARV